MKNIKGIKKFMASFFILFGLIVVPLTHADAQALPLSKDSNTYEIILQDGVTAKVLSDNIKAKVVETQDDKNIYVATYFKVTGELKYETHDLSRNLISIELLTDDIGTEVADEVFIQGGKLIRKNSLGTRLAIGFIPIVENIFGLISYVLA